MSLGQSFRNSADKLGSDGIDELLFLDYRISDGNTSINADFAVKYNELMESLSGGVGSIMNLAASVLTNLNPLLFEELYFANAASELGDADSSDAHTVWAMFDFARTVKKGLSTAAGLDENYATEKEAVDYFSGIYADYNLLNDAIYNVPDAHPREYYKAEAKAHAEEFLENINALHKASEKYETFDALKTYSSENTAEFAELLGKARFISEYRLNLESAVTGVFSTLTKAAIVRIFTGTTVPQTI